MSEIFNHRSPDTILKELIAIFQAFQPDVAVNEASTLYFLFQMFAFVSAQNMDLAERFAQAAFIATAEEDDLTNLAADRGITRISAIPALVLMEFSRAVATASAVTIPASSSFSTEVDESGNSLVFKNFDALTIPASSLAATGLGMCQTPGAIGNVVADTIVNILSSISGLDTVNNPASAYAGADGETDVALRDRVRDFLSNNTGKITTSGYKQTLESFSGVQSAIVVPGTGAMPNHITAIVTSSTTSDGIPTAEQLAIWGAAVNSDDNRAVVDVIDVIAPTSVPITVSATISSYATTADEATTRANVQQSIIDFINGLEAGSTVRVVDISNIIHDDAGVLDFSLTAPVANTVLSTYQKATASTATVTIS